MNRLKKSGITTTAAAAAAVVVVLLLCLFYYFADPGLPFMPHCAFKAATGYECPGCGFQRALHALLHGEVAAAWNYNPFAFFAVPAAVYFLIVEAGRRRWPRLARASVHPLIIAAILLAVLAWWIGRNI